MFAFLRHIASSCAEVGLRGLAGVVPFGSLVFDIASNAVESYRKAHREADLAADLEAVLRADQTEIRTAAATFAREVASGSPVEIQAQLESYLTQIPSVARQSLRRPEDTSGKSVPAQLPLTDPARLAAILPQRPPRFRVGEAVPQAGQWILQELLGAGGFGEVWLAKHNFLDEQRAFKFCLDPLARNRLLQHEGEVVKRVMKAGLSLKPDEHGIVRLLDTYLEGATPWLAYEYVSGGDLAGLVRYLVSRSAARRAEVALKLLRSLALVVGRLHRLRQPIMHRDLKPANVLIRQVEGKIILRVTDFGIGSAASEHALRQASVSTPSMMMGESLRGAHTPLYASPQQKKGRNPDVRDDVYALGIIGYQLLTCDLTAEKPAGKWRKKLAEAAIPDEVLDLLESCWADDPDERPADAIVLAEGLKPKAKVVPVPIPVRTWEDVLADFQAYQNAPGEEKWLREHLAGSDRWRAAAAAGVVEGMVLLGLGYEYGVGVEKDEAAAARWYRKAADLGNADAMTNLGASYAKGIGLTKDETEAVNWYRKAADMGYAPAMCFLGWMYADGRGLPKDEGEAMCWYRKAADLGYAVAMNCLGVCYANGTGVPKDEAEAVGWYRKAADLGNPRGMDNLGLVYANGRGIAKDETEAMCWYRKAADLGHAEAMYSLGVCYEDGTGVAQDEAEAVRWYRKAADLGDTDAMWHLGRMYRDGAGIAEDAAEAVRWFRKATDLRNASAMVRLGAMYENGSGVAKDEAEAVRWYRQSAELGDADAMYFLGECYDDGKGVAKDEAEAVRWYRQAAELEHPTALCCLGVRYANGSGVAKDEVEAVRWYRKAAELGDADAMNNLGGCYVDGTGVAKDEAEAARWYRKAADLGDADAMCYLGVMYTRGSGVAKDEAEAVRWFQKSADLGDGDAMNNLGWMYDNGTGVTKDEAEAVRWYRKAAELDNPAAMCNLAASYANGAGVSKDAIEAVRWFRKAADLDNVDAMFSLGVMYRDGIGVAKDGAAAVRWFRQVADLAHAEAMHALGVMYSQGRGVAKDKAEAMRWYQQAAALGHAGSRAALKKHGSRATTPDEDEKTPQQSSRFVEDGSAGLPFKFLSDSDDVEEEPAKESEEMQEIDLFGEDEPGEEPEVRVLNKFRHNAIGSTFNSQALSRLCEYLDSAEAVRTFDALLAILDQSTVQPSAAGPISSIRPELDQFEALLKPVAVRLHERELLRFLDHPLAAGKLQRTLLDVLAAGKNRSFRNTWDYFDTTASNGNEIDVEAPGTNR